MADVAEMHKRVVGLKMNIIVETNWMNKQMHKGIKKHYQSLQQACESNGAELIGLFKPLNDAWNWTHFIKVNTLEKWRDTDREVHRLYPEIDNNVTCSMSRLYRGIGGLRTPPIRDPKRMKYLVVGLNNFTKINLGVEYYSQRCDQFEGLEGAGLLGLYEPNSEIWDWATIKLYDSIDRYLDVGMEYQKTYPRIPELTSYTERMYEKYEP
jgi:hypothetical protein